MAISKAAGVYLRRGTLFLRSDLKEPNGSWVPGPVATVSADASDGEIGKALKTALAASGPLQGPIPSAEVIRAPLLAAAGVRSQSAFYETGTKSLDVYQRNGTISLTPMKRGRSRGVFLPIVEAKLTLAVDSDDATLGRAMREAMTLSQ